MKRIVTIQDQSRAITAIAKEAPRKGMLAEFIKNAREAGSSEIHIDEIKIGPAYKAIIVNDGKGMDAETIQDMGAIFGSPKARNNKTEDNYNTGARVMAIHNNEQGLSFTSKHNGIVRNVVLTVENGEYLVEDNNPKFMKDYGLKYGFKGDWTAVIMMGNSVKQGTLQKPYGNVTTTRPFEEQLTLRFNDDGGIPTYIKGEKVKFNKERLPNKQWLVEASSNVKIRYQLTDNPVNSLLTSKGERFAIEKGKGASSFAGSAMTTLGTLGAYAVQDELSITVELGEKHNSCQTNYRDALQHPVTRERLGIDNFMPDIERHMPKELRDYIENKEGRKQSRAVKSKSRELLKSMMKKLGLNLNGLVQSADGQEQTENRKRKERGEVVKRGKTDDTREKPKPTVGEQKDGLPTMTTHIIEAEEWMNKKSDIGYVMGLNCYIVGTHTFLDGMSEGKKQSFAQYLADAYIVAIAYEVDSKASRAVLIALALMALAEGTFDKAYTADQKKG